VPRGRGSPRWRPGRWPVRTLQESNVRIPCASWLVTCLPRGRGVDIQRQEQNNKGSGPQHQQQTAANITQAQALANGTSPMKPESGHHMYPMGQSCPPNLPSRCSASAFRFLHLPLATETGVHISHQCPSDGPHVVHGLVEKTAQDVSKCSSGAKRKCRSAMTAVWHDDSTVSCQGSSQ
jgi:hypothetical protein